MEKRIYIPLPTEVGRKELFRINLGDIEVWKTGPIEETKRPCVLHRVIRVATRAVEKLHDRCTSVFGAYFIVARDVDSDGIGGTSRPRDAWLGGK